jgi:hypothetical protein
MGDLEGLRARRSLAMVWFGHDPEVQVVRWTGMYLLLADDRWRYPCLHLTPGIFVSKTGKTGKTAPHLGHREPPLAGAILGRFRWTQVKCLEAFCNSIGRRSVPGAVLEWISRRVRHPWQKAGSMPGAAASGSITAVSDWSAWPPSQNLNDQANDSDSGQENMG